MFILAQILGALVIILNVISMQMKHKKQIVFMFALINIFSAITFVLLQGYSGTIICLFSVIQIIINNFFETKEKQVPKTIIGLYIITSIALGIPSTIASNNYIEILPIICSILYTITIVQEKEKNIRKISLVNIILWIIFDIASKAYTSSISDTIMLISILIGIYRLDIKKSD